MSPAFEFRIDRVVRLTPAEMNAEFFTVAAQELGEVSSEEDVRRKIAENIEAYNSSITEVTLENEIFKYLGDTTDIPLPEVFLRKWFEKTNEKDLKDEDLE